MHDALHLLVQLGWNYLTPEQVDSLRGGRTHTVILTPFLTDYMRAHCRVYYKGEHHPFTENAIQTAVQALKGLRTTGTAQHEQAYDLLCLGTSVPQAIDGHTKSFSIHFIDWKNPARNTYHCTTRFRVSGHGCRDCRSADIVLFVNGIPLVVIACQAPDPSDGQIPGARDPLDRAVCRLKACQGREGIPRLFLFAQLLIALSRDRACYGTTGTPPLLWSVWKEDGLDEPLRRILDLPLDEQLLERLPAGPRAQRAQAGCRPQLQGRTLVEPDRLLYALCRPERLLELIYQFVLFHDGSKKIARCHQYLTIQDILRRVLDCREGRPRAGGVVWHTQGSGKSLTMVMLAKCLALHPQIENPRIVLVTDRIDLEDQIYGTFRACGLVPEQAATGKHLAALLSDSRARIITTLIHKFAAAMGSRTLKRVDANTFVLVDEGHRSQYNHQHARMRRTLAGACFIAFTGTPLAKSASKNTFARFGDLFRPPYTIARAVSDQTVTPLLYEARHVPQFVHQKAADAWFGKMIQGFTREQKADLRRRFLNENRLNTSLAKVRMIAWDISLHFFSNSTNTGLKGQLVAPDKLTALKYKHFLDQQAMLTSEVLISAPCAREGEDATGEPSVEEKQFWQAMMDRFGSERNYNRQLISGFKYGAHPEIIIVVDKLLTGFDAACNAVLYLARRLKGHTLLQAIARVNRLHEAKEYGLILDYSGVIQDLDRAVDFYDQLADYDPADLESTIMYVRESTAGLSRLHAELLGIFHPLKVGKDPEGFEILLRDSGLRERFDTVFKRYARTLRLALSSSDFLMSVTNRAIRRYQSDFEFFQNLKAAVIRRHQDVTVSQVDEPQIRKLIDSVVGAGKIEQLCPPIDLQDMQDARKKRLFLQDDQPNAATRVNLVASATRYFIQRQNVDNPNFYGKISKLLEDVIQTYQAGRMQEKAALERIKQISMQAVNHSEYGLPPELKNRQMARRFYGCIRECVPVYSHGSDSKNPGTHIALQISRRLARYKIRDWRSNPDILNRMRGEIDEILFEAAEKYGIDLCLEDQDAIIDRCIEVAIACED